MTFTRALLLAALLVIPTAARAQIVQGFVQEDSTEIPISGVRVELRGASGAASVTETDTAGAFRFDLRTGGRYVLRVRHPSYAAVDSVVVNVGSSDRVQVTMRMGRSPIALAPVIVRARADDGVAGFRDRMARGAFGRFIGRAEVDRAASGRTTDLLRTLPGVEVTRTRSGGTMVLMRGGGSGRCVPDVFVDGMLLRQFADSGVDTFISPASLEGVEVYTSRAGAPAMYQTPGACGVLGFWTRPAQGGRWSWRKLAIGVGLFVGVVLLVR
jgi:hypothetical protein